MFNMTAPVSFTCEEAFVIALQSCDDWREIEQAIVESRGHGVGINDVGAYDAFIISNTTMRYCDGCQAYHDIRKTKYEKRGLCSFSHECIVSVNQERKDEKEKRRDILLEDIHR